MLIGDQDPWDVLQPLEQLAEKPLGGGLIPVRPYQDVQDQAVLINCPPQILRVAIDLQKYLVEMPFVPRPGTAPLRPRSPAPTLFKR